MGNHVRGDPSVPGADEGHGSRHVLAAVVDVCRREWVLCEVAGTSQEADRGERFVDQVLDQEVLDVARRDPILAKKFS